MDSPRQSKKANRSREAKCNQNHSSTPQKDAYARLVSQHNSSKFRLYLEQYAKESTFQGEENGPRAPTSARSDRLDIPQRKKDQMFIEFSDSSDFSPSSMKSRGEESSLYLYMEKRNSRGGQQDCDKKHSVSDRQRRGQRRDTATSHDGDIESGEELSSLKLKDSKQQQKQQKKSKERDHGSKEAVSIQSPKKISPSGPEQDKTKKLKKKNLAKNYQEEKSSDLFSPGVDAEMSRPKSPQNKTKKLTQLQGKL